MNHDLGRYLAPWVQLRHRLITFLQQYVTAADAARIVRLTLAELYRCAFTAWHTDHGPYALALDIACGKLASDFFVRSQDFPAATFQQDFVTDESEVSALCKAYAQVYEAGYRAALTYTEREELAMLLRLHDLPQRNDAQIRAYLAYGGSEADALRRVVQGIDDHPHGKQMVCIVSQQIEDDEKAKSYAWMKLVRAQKEDFS